MKKLVENKKKVTTEMKGKIVDNNELSKSQKMKNLFDLGLDIKEISQLMNVRYNFVYNVISNYVNMNGITVIQETKENKKELILKMFQEGKSNKEISIELKTNYNYVFNTIKQYKNSIVDQKESNVQ